MSELKINCGWYAHNKTGNAYIVTGVATDCTNGAPEREFVVYRQLTAPYRLFVRELTEFTEKFTWKES
jgi:hypothetical protein